MAEREGFVRLRQGYGEISSRRRSHPAEARAEFETRAKEDGGGRRGSTRGLRRDRPAPTTAHRSRPRKSGSAVPLNLAVRCRSWTRVWNGLQILAKAGTFGRERLQTASDEMFLGFRSVSVAGSQPLCFLLVARASAARAHACCRTSPLTVVFCLGGSCRSPPLTSYSAGALCANCPNPL